jgi:hypothetical protein
MAQTNIVQMDLDSLGSITLPDLNASGNWTLSTVADFYRIQTVVLPSAIPGTTVIRLTPDRPVDYTEGPALVRFKSANGSLEAVCQPAKVTRSSLLPTLTKDPKTADISITGALQAAVGDRPQYSYTVDAKYNVLPYLTSHELAATFKAVASQEYNADPDTMKLAANYRWLHNLPNHVGFIFSSDLIAYEFQRAIKQDTPVALGVPIPTYINKNSNRVHSATAMFIYSRPKQGSFAFRPLGIEAGQSITRTVKAASQGVTDTSILRGVFGADYYNFRKEFWGFKRIDFEAHHTQRILHFAEPYVRAGVNGGKQYLSRYARPVSTAKLTFSLRDGFGVSFAYLRGSQPPSFKFVNHQLTIGLTILLKRS